MTRRISLVLIAVTLLWGAFPQAVSADGMIMPDLATADYMVVRYHDVTVEIKDTFAVTQVEQEFYNPHNYPITGYYIFPIPPGAAVTNFQATFGGQRQTIVQQNGRDSNVLLYNLIAERHDSSLLQYADWETLSFNIELPARTSRKMTLAYQEVLAPSGGMLHYHYVLSTERYSSLPLEHASIKINITSSNGIASVYSSSHEVNTEYRSENHAKVIWEDYNTQPVNDFHLFITPSEAGFGSGFLTGTHNDTDHFLFMFSPERVNQQRDALAKEIVFVIDRSGSMAGEKITQAREALHYILDQLNENDRFSIVGFDDVFSTVANTLLPVNRVNLSDAHRFVSGLYDRNGTNIEGALQIGLRLLDERAPRTGASRMIVFLTDGLPTEGIIDPQLIVDLISRANDPIDARLHVFGVGYDVNTHLLDQLAEKNGGSVTYVQPGENLEAVLSGFYERIANPILTDLSIEFDGITVSHLYPQHLPDLFEGSTLLLTGLYTRGEEDTAVITIRGNANGVKYSSTYEAELTGKENMTFVPGLWATRRIGHLLDIIRVEGESTSLVEEVRELGLNYGLVTPYTTYVITAQTEGAASAENMALYGNKFELNRSSGQTTIQARVQNQSYQQATQVDLARGANILSNNGQNMVQMRDQAIDLNLLRNYKEMDLVITDDWIASNVNVDRHVTFGSKVYFELAADPVARSFMQSGNNVIFELKGEVIEITDSEMASPSQTINPENTTPIERHEPNNTHPYRDFVKIRISRFFRSILRFLVD